MFDAIRIIFVEHSFGVDFVQSASYGQNRFGIFGLVNSC